MNYPQQKPRGFFRRFFGGIGALITFLRNLVLNVFFLFFLVILIVAIGSSAPKPLPEKFALRVAPSGVLVDQRTYIDTASLLFKDEQEDSETVVRDVVDAINRASDDKRIDSIVLELGGLGGGGITKMSEIGQALNAFKAKGKKIIATSDSYSQDQYFLASYADEIYLHTMGEVQLTGFGRYITYYKSALDKLGVNVHVFRSGKYKDYVEPFLRDNMSDESREHNSQWLNALWAQYTQTVETQRKLPEGSLNKLINNLDAKLAEVKGDSAQLALNEKLVDKLVSRNEIDKMLIEKFGKSDEGNFYNAVGVHSYLAEAHVHKLPKQTQVGLLVASGTIQDGHQQDGAIGSENFVDMLRGIEEDESIKALVIRIDSGGGSAFASEIIRAEIDAIRKRNIPVYISMGSVAASGGYWMATAGDEIWATPTTITGSIGVFGAFPTLENSLQKIGLNTDGISTTELGGALSIDRPLAPKMNSVIQAGVDHTYQSFIKLVADARKQDVAAIHEIAQGHVWTGAKAKEIGLVDNLGTLNDVIAAAAAKAELKDYSVKLITQKLSPKEELIRKLVGEDAKVFVPKSLLKPFAELNLVQQQISPLLKPLVALQKMTDPQGIYATCLECVSP
ncbi:signal peptide peptidase SppA [Cellvibrio sp.]|uniref:signal peptide peptidase SppA n=1 Tax=Cellvibrio sp. TaxID=1965322 RepID=UPI0039647BCB